MLLTLEWKSSAGKELYISGVDACTIMWLPSNFVHRYQDCSCWGSSLAVYITV